MDVACFKFAHEFTHLFLDLLRKTLIILFFVGIFDLLKEDLLNNIIFRRSHRVEKLFIDFIFIFGSETLDCISDIFSAVFYCEDAHLGYARQLIDS